MNAPSDKLRQHGLKVTLPRAKVLDLLRRKACHLSADDIHRLLIQQGDDLGLATVYRVLSHLEQVGMVRRSHIDAGRAVFEIETGGHHDHLVCLRCGQVQDFHDDDIERLQDIVAQRLGFALREHRLALYGTCALCRAASSVDDEAAS
jgi:Fur family transcriptional regulator, ferric uptake regulator